MNTRTRVNASTIGVGTKRLTQFSLTTGVQIETNLVSSVAASYAGLTESITSEDPKKKRMGYCSHSRARTQLFEADFYCGWSYGRRYVLAFTGGYLAKEILNPRLGLMTTPLTFQKTDWSGLSFQSMKRFREDLDKEPLLGLAYAAELKRTLNLRSQYKDLKKALKSLDVRKLVKILGGLNPKYARSEAIKWARNAIKGIANINLWYQFGAAPFVRDTYQIVSRLNSLDKRISDMIAEAGKLRTKHWSKTLETNSVLPADGVVWTDNGQYALIRKFEWVDRPVYHATIQYKYNADELKGLLGNVRAHLHTLGVDRPLSTAWELLPYSFIVDWFIDVSGFLASIEDLLINPIRMEIVDFCHSTKYRYQTSMLFVCYDENPAFNPKKIIGQAPVGVYTESNYVRQRAIPTLVDLQSAKGLTVNRVGLAASLIAQKFL